ncbi:hypothetical protein AB6E26_25770, partial [Vibrio splendidus]
MRWLIIKNALITLTIGFVIVWLSSRGDYLATASVYPTDFVFLWLGADGSPHNFPSPALCVSL